MFMVWVGLFDMNVLIMKVLFCIAPSGFRKVEILARKRESERDMPEMFGFALLLGMFSFGLSFLAWFAFGIFCFSWNFLF